MYCLNYARALTHLVSQQCVGRSSINHSRCTVQRVFTWRGGVCTNQGKKNVMALFFISARGSRTRWAVARSRAIGKLMVMGCGACSLSSIRLDGLACSATGPEINKLAAWLIIAQGERVPSVHQPWNLFGAHSTRVKLNAFLIFNLQWNANEDFSQAYLTWMWYLSSTLILFYILLNIYT